ncbi:MAG: zinc-ribbon domain containing protein [Dehalococcoidia bacterium]
MAFEDKSLVCRDCAAEFVFTAGEQEFYQSRGLENEPGRCPECRQSRRQSRYGSAGRAPRERTQVTCSACGKEAEVPFVPRTGRPVYCDDCFTKERRGELPPTAGTVEVAPKSDPETETGGGVEVTPAESVLEEAPGSDDSDAGVHDELAPVGSDTEAGDQVAPVDEAAKVHDELAPVGSDTEADDEVAPVDEDAKVDDQLATVGSDSESEVRPETDPSV